MKIFLSSGIHLTHGQLLAFLMIAKATVVVGHCRLEEEVLEELETRYKLRSAGMQLILAGVGGVDTGWDATETKPLRRTATSTFVTKRNCCDPTLQLPPANH